jgi:hypothetical protein
VKDDEKTAQHSTIMFPRQHAPCKEEREKHRIKEVKDRQISSVVSVEHVSIRIHTTPNPIAPYTNMSLTAAAAKHKGATQDTRASTGD